MSLFRRAAHNLSGTAARAMSPETTFAGFPLGFLSHNKASTGNDVTQDNAMQVLAVYGCVRIYSHVVGSLPMSAYFASGESRERLFNPPAWVSVPQANGTIMNWATQIVHSLLLDGNCFLAKLYNEVGDIVELVPLNPRLVGVDRDPETNQVRYSVSGKYYTTYDILHIKYMSVAGRERGLSPIACARETIGLGLALDEFGGRFFANGAHLSGALEVPNQLTPEAAAMLKSEWESSHGGLSTAHRPAVLSGGVKYTSISVSPEDAQFLATRAYTASSIAAQLYGIPPHMLGESNGTSNYGTGVEAQVQGWLVTGLNPLLEIIEQALSSVIRDRGFVKFKTDALLRSDAKTRNETYRLQLETGISSLNEVRAREDLRPLTEAEGGNMRFRPANWLPLTTPAPDTTSGTTNPERNDA